MFRKQMQYIYLGISLILIVAPSIVFARPTILNAPGMLDTVAGKSGVEQTSVTAFTGTLIKGGLTAVGIVFLILMVYAGFRWMTARGDDEKVQRAKLTVSAAVIGLAVVISSYALTSFITNRIVEGSPNSGTTLDFENLDYSVYGCCFDKVRAPGGTGELHATSWAWRITTAAQCEQEGNNDHSSIDEIYGPGTWQFTPVDSQDQCKAKYDEFCKTNDCYDLGF